MTKKMWTFEGEKYNVSGLYSLRNRLRDKVILVDPLEELMALPTQRHYEGDGVLLHITELAKKLKNSEGSHVKKE
jgi:hypothetical protein